MPPARRSFSAAPGPLAEQWKPEHGEGTFHPGHPGVSHPEARLFLSWAASLVEMLRALGFGVPLGEKARATAPVLGASSTSVSCVCCVACPESFIFSSQGRGGQRGWSLRGRQTGNAVRSAEPESHAGRWLETRGCRSWSICVRWLERSDRWWVKLRTLCVWTPSSVEFSVGVFVRVMGINTCNSLVLPLERRVFSCQRWDRSAEGRRTGPKPKFCVVLLISRWM